MIDPNITSPHEIITDIHWVNVELLGLTYCFTFQFYLLIPRWLGRTMPWDQDSSSPWSSSSTEISCEQLPLWKSSSCPCVWCHFSCKFTNVYTSLTPRNFGKDMSKVAVLFIGYQSANVLSYQP